MQRNQNLAKRNDKRLKAPRLLQLSRIRGLGIPRQLLLGLLFVGFPSCVQSQSDPTSHVTGRVVDRISHTPIGGADIVLVDTCAKPQVIGPHVEHEDAYLGAKILRQKSHPDGSFDFGLLGGRCLVVRVVDEKEAVLAESKSFALTSYSRHHIDPDMGILSNSAAFKTFHDSTHGVSFYYPALWEPSDGMHFYMGAAILNSANGPAKPIAAVGFYGGSHDSNLPYPHSNLDGIQFVYAVHAAADEAGCKQIAKDNMEDEMGDAPESNVTIHGMRYMHLSGGEGGLGHNAAREVYAAYQSGQCYLFEQDIHMIAPDVEPGERLLSKDETARLRAQLNAVMQSVRME